MSAPLAGSCSRTDAVLAVHLDGDLEPSPPIDRDTCGYGFVSDNSLHEHLRQCAWCQQALQRARRLDAVLALSAGRAMAGLVKRDQVSTDQVSTDRGVQDRLERLLNRAALAAGHAPAAGSGQDVEQDVEQDVASTIAALEPVGGRLAGGRVAGGSAAGSRVAVGAAIDDRALARSSFVGTSVAAGGVILAAVATWLCLAPMAISPEQVLANQTAKPQLAEAQASKVLAAKEWAAKESTTGTRLVEPKGVAQSDQVGDAFLPSSLARRMHAARKRELPEQRSLSPRELAKRMANRALSVPDRLAAANRLMRATRPGSMAARHATDALLLALAGCGDSSNHEVAVHDELLDNVRANTALLVRIAHRLTSVPSENRRGPSENRRGERERQASNLRTTELYTFTLNTPTLAAIVVAARLGDVQLDIALRRASRQHSGVAEAIASGLRCGARLKGATELLLDCWHDQVAIGRQENTPQWAEFWFRGQAQARFHRLPELLHASRSASERIRCLLAMGCVGDDSTVRPLLAELRSPRLDEACAAACGLAVLPHWVLNRLLPKAKHLDASLLRAAMARAGLPAAQAWIATLDLNKPQRSLLRGGSLARFSEVATWFRNGPLLAD